MTIIFKCLGTRLNTWHGEDTFVCDICEFSNIACGNLLSLIFE